MYVVTDSNDSLLIGPKEWIRGVQKLVGLEGNRIPPSRPYTAANGNVLRDVTYEALDAYQTHGDPTIVNDEWFFPAVDNALDESKEEAKAALAAKRYEIETGGTSVGGTPIETDRDTQSKLIAVRIVAKEDANYVVNWKTSAGFIQLDALTLIAIADAVRNHVQAAFNNEKTIFEAIDAAADLAALRVIDFNRGW